MKHLFVILFVALVGLSAVAWAIQPRADRGGRTPLVWMSDDNPARREQIALFNRANPAYALDLDVNTAGMEKMIVQSIAEVGPDLFDCYNGFQLSTYVRSGIAWDVTDELAEAGIDLRRDVWPATHPIILYEGRAYGFPTNVGANAIWFNKEIFDRLGIPYPKKGPWEWERDFVPLAQKLTVRDAAGRIVHFGYLQDSWNWQQFLIQWGGRLYTDDGTRCIVDSPEGCAAMQFMQDLIYKHHVMPSPAEEAALATQGGWGSGSITFFGGGKGAMALGGRWWLCTLRNYKCLRLGAVESPHGPRRVFWGYGRATLVNRNSPRRQDALAFLRYMAAKGYNDLVNHQADAIAPVIRYCQTQEYLHDPEYPEEDFNDVWRDIMAYAVPEQVSPFVNGNVATRIFTKQVDLLLAGQKTGAEAMRAAAAAVNAEIRKEVQRDPALRQRYERLAGGVAP